MRENIKSVLKKLGKRSELEKSEKIQVNHDERMLTISNETGEFYNILLKAMKAKKNSRGRYVSWIFYIMVCRCNISK